MMGCYPLGLLVLACLHTTCCSYSSPFGIAECLSSMLIIIAIQYSVIIMLCSTIHIHTCHRYDYTTRPYHYTCTFILQGFPSDADSSVIVLSCNHTSVTVQFDINSEYPFALIDIVYNNDNNEQV